MPEFIEVPFNENLCRMDAKQRVLPADDDRVDPYMLLSFLSDRYREIVAMKFGINGYSRHTYAEIGDSFGISKGRVFEITHKALRIMKNKARLLYA
jgi:DNA-directed RNA polymerase sigma subunit (sigma70/sigma32)